MMKFFTGAAAALAFLSTLATGVAAQQPPSTLSQPAPSAVEVDIGHRLRRGPETPVPFSCPFCDLRGVNFAGRDLTNANLHGADLRGADLTRAILDGAILIGADLTNAQLTDARLNPSSKGRTDLSLAKLDGANFRNASLRGADIQYTSLNVTTLQGADVTEAITARPGRVRANDGENVTCGTADLSGVKNRIYVTIAGTDSDSCGAGFNNACATISKGIARCTGTAACGVLVGWGDYKAADTIALQDGVNVYGGCMPASQTAAGLQSLIEAPSNGKPAVSASGTKSAGVVLHGFKLVGSSAQGNGAASTTLFADNARLTVQDSTITAGAGGNGNAGGPTPKGGDGSAGNGSSGGAGTTCGGANGGNGSVRQDVSVRVDFPKLYCTPSCSDNGCWGYTGSPGTTGNWAGGGEWGKGNCTECPISRGDTGHNGSNGSNASCGGPGNPSGATGGSFNGLQWQPSVSGSGNSGGNGGGGGGGGAGGYQAGWCFFVTTENPGNRGGGGGGGGCGGNGGAGGQQGGASFAAVLNNSTVVLARSTVIGGRGGNGGNGGTGGSGGKGGDGASGLTNEKGAYGGRGGNGGNGGGGGGGAGGNGGPAVNVAQLGSSVTDGDSTYYAGTSGTPGTGGQGGGSSASCTGTTGNSGNQGMVIDRYDYR